MNGLFDFPPDLRAASEAAMLPGESVAWAGRPSPAHAFLSTIAIWLFAIPWTAISLVFFTSAVAAVIGVAEIEGMEGAGGWLFFLFSLPFLAVGVLSFSAPFWAARDASASGFVITDRRVMKISAHNSGASAGRSIKALTAGALRGAEAKVGRSGRGVVKALGPVGKDKDGDSVTDEIVMAGVADAQGAERALWRLIETHRNNR